MPTSKKSWGLLAAVWFVAAAPLSAQIPVLRLAVDPDQAAPNGPPPFTHYVTDEQVEPSPPATTDAPPAAQPQTLPGPQAIPMQSEMLPLESDSTGDSFWSEGVFSSWDECMECCPVEQFTCAALPRKWYLSGDAVWLKRTRGDMIPLSQVIGAEDARLTTHDIEFQFRPGVNIVLGRQVGENSAIELAYLGLFDWGESTALSSAGPQFSPWLLTPANTTDYLYGTELNDGQINFRQRLDTQGRLTASALGGFRYIDLRERFSLFGTNNVTGDIEQTNVNTFNHMFGLQAGGDVEYWIGRLALGAEGKAGLFLNLANQTTVNTFNNVPFLNAGEREETAATAVDFSVFARYYLFPNVVLRGGYEAIFLGGIAMAPEQIVATGGELFAGSAQGSRTGQTVNSKGYSIYYGPSAGLELIWGGPRAARRR